MYLDLTTYYQKYISAIGFHRVANNNEAAAVIKRKDSNFNFISNKVVLRAS